MMLHVFLFGLLTFILGFGTGFGAGEMLDAPGHREIVALKACESEIPRNQRCKVIITAVPLKEGL